MRLLSSLTGLLLITTGALAQPADYSAGPGPGYDPSQPAMPDAGQPPGPAGQQDSQGASGMRHQHVPFKQRFETANVTHDGRLTLDQARQGHLGMVVRNFSEIDADHKGYVTVQDVHAWHHARHQARAQQQGQGQGQAPLQ